MPGVVGVADAVRIAVEHRNVDIQRLLMDNAVLVYSKDIVRLIKRTSVDGNAEGLHMILYGVNLDMPAPLEILTTFPNDEAHREVVNLLLRFVQIEIMDLVRFFMAQPLAEQKVLLPLIIGHQKNKHFGATTARTAIHAGKHATLKRVKIEPKHVPEVMRAALAANDLDATMLLLRHLDIHPDMRHEYCELAKKTRGNEEIAQLLCTPMVKGTRKTKK